MPYDHRLEVATGPGNDSTLRMLRTLNDKSCNRSCVVGSGGASVGYLAHGTATDFMYQELHIPVAMTWEIYGDEQADTRDCFRMFNPLTATSYEQTVQQWSFAIMRLILLLAEHPAVQHLHLPPPGQSAPAGGVAGRQQTFPAPSHSREVSQVSNSEKPHQDAAQHGALGVTHSGVRHVKPFEVYNPTRSLVAGALLFVMTVALWCIARRFLGPARKRGRTGDAAKGKEGASRHE